MGAKKKLPTEASRSHKLSQNSDLRSCKGATNPLFVRAANLTT